MNAWRKWLLVAAGLLALLILVCNLWVIHAGTGRVFGRVEDVPAKPVALVLGTAQKVGPWENLHFRYRMDAAAELWRAGKAKHFLLSGDNHRPGYDEPSDMRDALVTRGIPATAITLDYAGFRTLDSVVRAKEVFGCRQLIIVSGEFHNYRAVFTARRYGLDAVAYNAKPVSLRFDIRSPVRESLARVKAVLDLYLLRTAPKFLGPRVELPVSS